MATYKPGDKFVIEIDSVMTSKKGTLYGIKGFKSLVFDEYGLSQLEKAYSDKSDMLDMVGLAYKSGVQTGTSEGAKKAFSAMKDYVTRVVPIA